MSLRAILSNYGFIFKEVLGPLGARCASFITVLEFVQIERLLPSVRGLPGRPQQDRVARARTFIAKACPVLDTGALFAILATQALIERLAIDCSMRRLCGWSAPGEVPSEATFSRAFGAFADSALPSRLHEALIGNTMQERLVGHVSRDSTAIEGREKPHRRRKWPSPKRRRGRPRKGEEGSKQPRRLQRDPDVGVKQGAKGHRQFWVGYKLHIDAADGGIPISCPPTSASVHDSQVAIPLATLTSARLTNLYDPGSNPGQVLMDSAYDAPEIRAYSASLGHVPIIDVNARSGERKQALKTETRAPHRRPRVCRDITLP